MSFFESIRICLLDFANFKGRSRRSEFWWFQLFLVILMVIAMVIDTMVLNYTLEDTFSPFLFGLEVLIFFPSLSVGARRLHDIGMSGWYQAPLYLMYLEYLKRFLPPIPDNFVLWGQGFLFIYLLWMIILWVRDSTEGDNRYGAKPKL